MMKTWKIALLTSALLTSATAMSQHTETRYYWNGMKQAQYQANAAGVPDGTDQEWDIDGRLLESGTYHDGIKSGTWTSYFPSMCVGVQYVTVYGAGGGPPLGGTILSDSPERVLSYTSYDCVGGRRFKLTVSTWSDGAFTVSHYYSNGQLKEKYRSNDAFGMSHTNGKYEGYYTDGHPMVSGSFDDGGRSGRWEWRLKNGKVANSSMHKDGMMVDSTALDTLSGMRMIEHIDTVTWLDRTCTIDGTGTGCMNKSPYPGYPAGTRPIHYFVNRQDFVTPDDKLLWWKEFDQQGNMTDAMVNYPDGMWKIVHSAELPTDFAVLEFDKSGTLTDVSVRLADGSMQKFTPADYKAKWPNSPMQ